MIASRMVAYLILNTTSPHLGQLRQEEPNFSVRLRRGEAQRTRTFCSKVAKPFQTVNTREFNPGGKTLDPYQKSRHVLRFHHLLYHGLHTI